jgi:hypothetical protein
MAVAEEEEATGEAETVTLTGSATMAATETGTVTSMGALATDE